MIIFQNISISEDMERLYNKKRIQNKLKKTNTERITPLKDGQRNSSISSIQKSNKKKSVRLPPSAISRREDVFEKGNDNFFDISSPDMLHFGCCTSPMSDGINYLGKIMLISQILYI